jgi:hypothetical protein
MRIQIQAAIECGFGSKKLFMIVTGTGINLLFILNIIGRNFADWLRSIGMDRFSSFLTSVNGANLLEMTEAKMIALGLPMADANRLLQHIQWLRHGNGQATSMQPSAPEEFLCPITHDIMRFPVRCADGFVYEEAAIQEKSSKITSKLHRNNV